MCEIQYHREREGCYRLDETFIYKSILFNRTLTLPKNYVSDGATGARDVGAEETGWRKYWAMVVAWLMDSPSKKETAAWFVHDWVCDVGEWDDGTKISNFICSTILGVILFMDGYKIESISWWFATFFGGGGLARENGMFRLKRKTNG